MESPEVPAIAVAVLELALVETAGVVVDLRRPLVAAASAQLVRAWEELVNQVHQAEGRAS
jgi:hypothetical protein